MRDAYRRGIHPIIYAMLLLVSFAWHVDSAYAQSPDDNKAGDRKRLIFSDDFEKPLDTLTWISEIEPLPGSSVSAIDGKLVLNTRGGVTVWLNKQLKGDLQIEYTRKVIIGDKENDRLSDLNQFWMAQAPGSSNLFTRNGKFEEYDDLLLYYVGMGGNTNTTTRFRKYNGDGERILIQEYKDSAHLLQPNHEYHIKIIVKDNTTSFYADNICYFSYNDPALLKQGYFAFRSTYSHQTIDHIKIYQLD